MSETLEKSALSGPDEAAAVLVMLGESTAATIMRHMDERAIAQISGRMAQMTALEIDDAAQVITRLAVDLESSGAISSDGFAFLRRVLTSAFGDSKATELIERVMGSADGKIDALAELDPKTLAEQMGHESPQLLAVMLGHMNRKAAVAFLNNLDNEKACEIVHRYARIDTVQPSALVEMRAMLADMLGGHVALHASAIGGVRESADLLNGLGQPAAEQVLAWIRERDDGLAGRIRENMFTFDDLSQLNDQAMQAVLRQVDPARLGPALRASAPLIRERIFANISQKQGAVLRDELENGPMISRAEALAAQRAIVDVAMTLAEEGKIVLGGSEDML